MKKVLLLVVVLVSCKKAENKAAVPEPSPPPPDPGVLAATIDAGTVTVGALGPCPTNAALKAVAAKAFGAKKPDDIGDVTCNEMSTPRKTWAVDGIVATGESFDGTLALLDARDGNVVWKDSTGSSLTGLAKAKIDVADLDGDGAEELLRSATEGGEGLAAETLHVLAWRNDKLVEVGKLPVRSENTGAVAVGKAKKKDAYECQSEHKVIDGAGKKLIEVVAAKRKGKPPAAECPPEGRHVYAFDGKAIAEAKAEPKK